MADNKMTAWWRNMYRDSLLYIYVSDLGIVRLIACFLLSTCIVGAGAMLTLWIVTR